ncbi:hypothetical protein MRX96_000572 [Rhipicephalus microplus]
MSAGHDECSEEASLLQPKSVAPIHAFRGNNLTMRPYDEHEQLPEGERWRDVRQSFYGAMAASLFLLLLIDLVLPLFFVGNGGKWWKTFQLVASTAAIVVLILTPLVAVTLCKRTRRAYSST